MQKTQSESKVIRVYLDLMQKPRSLGVAYACLAIVMWFAPEIGLVELLDCLVQKHCTGLVAPVGYVVVVLLYQALLALVPMMFIAAILQATLPRRHPSVDGRRLAAAIAIGWSLVALYAVLNIAGQLTNNANLAAIAVTGLGPLALSSLGIAMNAGAIK